MARVYLHYGRYVLAMISNVGLLAASCCNS